jgi:hypothetical protein
MLLSTPLLKYVESQLPPDHGGKLCVVATPSYYTVYWERDVRSSHIFVCSISIGQLLHRQYEVAIGAQIVQFVNTNLVNRSRLFNSLDLTIEAFKTM